MECRRRRRGRRVESCAHDVKAIVVIDHVFLPRVRGSFVYCSPVVDHGPKERSMSMLKLMVFQVDHNVE